MAGSLLFPAEEPSRVPVVLAALEVHGDTMCLNYVVGR